MAYMERLGICKGFLVVLAPYSLEQPELFLGSVVKGFQEWMSTSNQKNPQKKIINLFVLDMLFQPNITKPTLFHLGILQVLGPVSIHLVLEGPPSLVYRPKSALEGVASFFGTAPTSALADVGSNLKAKGTSLGDGLQVKSDGLQPGAQIMAHLLLKTMSLTTVDLSAARCACARALRERLLPRSALRGEGSASVQWRGWCVLPDQTIGIDIFTNGGDLGGPCWHMFPSIIIPKEIRTYVEPPPFGWGSMQ